MNLDLSGKTALVSGGARGIGAAISRALGAAGAKVVINFNKSGEKAEKIRDELRTNGFEAEIFQADVSEPAQVEKLFQFIRSSAGHLDILVNNAGVIRDTLLLTMSVVDWEKVHDVNLTGAFLMTRMAAELMVPRHSGKIINIASVSGIRGGRGQTNYASAKGGLISFTRACAVELASKGVQVNAVLPGFIETEMTVRTMRRAGEAILDRIPAHRFGRPARCSQPCRLPGFRNVGICYGAGDTCGWRFERLMILQGIDIVAVSKIKKIMLARPEFASEIFSNSEREYCFCRPDPYIHLAGQVRGQRGLPESARHGTVRDRHRWSAARNRSHARQVGQTCAFAQWLD